MEEKDLEVKRKIRGSQKAKENRNQKSVLTSEVCEILRTEPQHREPRTPDLLNAIFSLPAILINNIFD